MTKFPVLKNLIDIDGPRLSPERLREIIETKTFWYNEVFMFPGTWLDLLKEKERIKELLLEIECPDGFNLDYGDAFNYGIDLGRYELAQEIIKLLEDETLA